MTFVSDYRMIINLFKLELIYNSILCNTIVLSSTIIIVSKKIEYGQEMPQSQTTGQPMATWGKGHKVGISQALIVQHMYISCSFSFQTE